MCVGLISGDVMMELVLTSNSVVMVMLTAMTTVMNRVVHQVRQMLGV